MIQIIKGKYFLSFIFLICLSMLFIVLQLVTASNYPLFRDELYYIDCAKHLSFGYVDHPPISIFILSFWTGIFGDSLISIRILPALFGGFLIFFTGILTASLGGNRSAQILASISVFCVPVYWVLNGYYSMNSLDLVFWILLFYVIILIIKTGNEKLWITFGIIAGFGLMNKISVGYLGAGILVSILITQFRDRKWLRNKFFWAGGLIAAAIFTPYLVWSFQNEFASVEFIRNASLHKNAATAPFDFFKEQILLAGPLNFFIWITGITALFFSRKLKQFRLISFTFIFIFLLLAFTNSKPYYIVPVYTVLLSAGAVFISDFCDQKNIRFLKPVIGVLLIISMAFLLPAVIPVLSPADASAYLVKTGLVPKSGEKQAIGLLPQHFADRFGWEEMTIKAAAVYNSLTEEEKKHTAIYTQNYGQAGAINYYGKQFNLPSALSGHNNHFLWKPGIDSIATLVIIGGKIENHLKVFQEVTPVEMTGSEFSMPYENHLTVFIARKPVKPLKEIWISVKKYI